MKQSTITAKDGKELFVYEWIPSGEISSVVLMVHGLSEHGQRYAAFAEYLNKNGVAAISYDHRGHGQTAGGMDQLGYKEDGNFWDKTLSDLDQIVNIKQAEHPEKPFYILGHSMGSLMTRKYIQQQKGAKLSGAILSGTAGDPGFLAVVGRFIASIIALIKGRKHQSKTLMKMSFGKFNDDIQPQRTEFDWLSRKDETVDEYINDPYSGAMASVGLWLDFLAGIKDLNQSSTFDGTPKDLPLLLFAGDKDPVGANGKGVREVHQRYKDVGIKDLKLKLYEDARHECLNETNADEVRSDILAWINERH